MTRRRAVEPGRADAGPPAVPTLSLQQHEAALQLAAIVNSSDDAIISKTLEGIIVSWNPAAERMFGWTAGEAIGKSITLIIPEDRLAEEDHVLTQLRQGRSIEHYETIRVRKDGVQIPISLSVSPIRDLSGTIVGASKIARDISDRQRLDEERARLLAQEQAARQTAERASRVKDEFLATLSHELRTPLTAIMGWVRMLRQRILDGEASARALEIVDRNTQALTRLVEDILDISSITMGRFRLDSVPVDLATVVRAALDSVRHAASAKNIHLELAVDPVVRPVAGDAGRLQQVVWNLLSNAVKFTPDGGNVHVSLAQSGSYAEIRVRDDGQGISEEFAPRLFEAFSQYDASSTRQHGGLGMGLAIVRHLVELHGGTVRASSAGPGAGATFVVRLPQVLGQPLSDEEKAEAPGPSVLEGVRVLAVDDEADTRELIATVLRQAGAHVAVTGSVEEALGALTAAPPDVVVCDIAMPGRDGYALLHEARRRSARLARTPFVALTARVQESDRRRSLTEGFSVHVPKPVDPLELVEVVRTLSRR